MKKSEYIFPILTLIFFYLFLISSAFTNETKIFLSLKNNEVNVRVGPSIEHPIKFKYKKKYLPLEILDKYDKWRKTKDFENNSGWIHVSQLSKKKSGINKKNNSILYNRPTIYSKPIAILEKGRLVSIIKCKNMWCKITSGNYTGWIAESSLWGRIK